MRYFNGRGWQEFDELPGDVVLLVRSVGIDNVRILEDALREQKIPHFMAAERKDDVSFYVQEEQRDEIEIQIKLYLSQHG